MTETVRELKAPSAQCEVSIGFSPHHDPFSYSSGGVTYAPANTYYAQTGQTITFTATTVPYSGQRIIGYKWDFGDGATGYGNPVTHKYELDNPHTQVSLTVTDNYNRRWTARQILYLKRPPAPYIRYFDGENDLIETSVGNCSLTGAYSIVALMRSKDTGAWNPLISHQDAGGTLALSLQKTPAGLLSLEHDTNGSISEITVPSDDWVLVAVTKATGSVKPWFYMYDFATETWFSDEGALNFGDRPAQTKILFGDDGSGSSFKGHFAAVAEWKGTKLSEAQVKALKDVTHLKAWETQGITPSGLWLFNQASVSESVQDLIGTAHEVDHVGTTSKSEVPPIPYDEGSRAIGESFVDVMEVGINSGNWGSSAAVDQAAAAHFSRFDVELGTGPLNHQLAADLKLTILFPGPYDVGGVSALDPDDWVADTLAFYKANVTPAEAPVVEVLNEPYGTWFWGPSADSEANALAYRTLVQKTYEAFHNEYGGDAPKIVASVDGEWGGLWWEEECKKFVDGVTVHCYGGNGDKAESALGDRARAEEAWELTGMPLYITEVGWPTAISEPPTADSLQWTEAEQADNVEEFFIWARDTRYVAQVIYFAYRDFGVDTWYGLVRSDGSHKPSYSVVQNQTAIYDKEV